MRYTFLILFVLFFLVGCTEEELNQLLCEKPEGWKMKLYCWTQQNSGNDDSTSGPTSNDNSGKECRFDSDCSTICEGDVFWKRGCDPQTDKCKKTFETDCTTK